VIGAPAVAITAVDPQTPAFEAGLQVDDVVLEVEGEKADSTRTISAPMYANGGQAVEMLVLRDGEEMTINVIPRETGEYDPTVEGPIGVALGRDVEGARITRSPGEAFLYAGESIWDYVTLFVSVPKMLIQGELSPSEARPVSIIGISQIAGQSVEATAVNRDLFPILNMIAFINVALGLTNLLPIPALDGGRIMFVLLEAVRGRRIEPEREGMVHVIGMLLLLGLMALMMVQDVINPIIPF
jgi:regulator of sigma E protease